MSVRLKTFHHFLEEYPEYNPEVDTLDGVVDRMNDELNDLEDGIRNLNMTPQQSFEAVAIMINKSRLYVSAMAQEETIANCQGAFGYGYYHSHGLVPNNKVNITSIFAVDS